MKERFVKEMIADWRGASIVQGYGWYVLPWYEENKHKMQLHPKTREWIERQLKMEER